MDERVLFQGSTIKAHPELGFVTEDQSLRVLFARVLGMLRDKGALKVSTLWRTMSENPASKPDKPDKTDKTEFMTTVKEFLKNDSQFTCSPVKSFLQRNDLVETCIELFRERSPADEELLVILKSLATPTIVIASLVEEKVFSGDMHLKLPEPSNPSLVLEAHSYPS